ncbi:hypothetical protein, partial [Providencia rustigianii]|uniref:hypothetical protein n=1 Tax=Providencia rustigianii TaxID=158850 RepID=UPI00224313B1
FNLFTSEQGCYPQLMCTTLSIGLNNTGPVSTFYSPHIAIIKEDRSHNQHIQANVCYSPKQQSFSN